MIRTGIKEKEHHGPDHGEGREPLVHYTKGKGTSLETDHILCAPSMSTITVYLALSLIYNYTFYCTTTVNSGDSLSQDSMDTSQIYFIF
jgi:hypothetical protein